MDFNTNVIVTKFVTFCIVINSIGTQQTSYNRSTHSHGTHIIGVEVGIVRLNLCTGTLCPFKDIWRSGLRFSVRSNIDASTKPILATLVVRTEVNGLLASVRSVHYIVVTSWEPSGNFVIENINDFEFIVLSESNINHELSIVIRIAYKMILSSRSPSVDRTNEIEAVLQSRSSRSSSKSNTVDYCFRPLGRVGQFNLIATSLRNSDSAEFFNTGIPSLSFSHSSDFCRAISRDECYAISMTIRSGHVNRDIEVTCFSKTYIPYSILVIRCARSESDSVVRYGSTGRQFCISRKQCAWQIYINACIVSHEDHIFELHCRPCGSSVYAYLVVTSSQISQIQCADTILSALTGRTFVTNSLNHFICLVEEVKLYTPAVGVIHNHTNSVHNRFNRDIPLCIEKGVVSTVMRTHVEIRSGIVTFFQYEVRHALRTETYVSNVQCSRQRNSSCGLGLCTIIRPFAGYAWVTPNSGLTGDSEHIIIISRNRLVCGLCAPISDVAGTVYAGKDTILIGIDVQFE